MEDLCLGEPIDAMSLALVQPQLDAITAACRKHHVAHLHAFCSVLRPDYRPGESDIDLLVEFLPMDASKLYRALRPAERPEAGPSLSGRSGDGRRGA